MPSYKIIGLLVLEKKILTVFAIYSQGGHLSQCGPEVIKLFSISAQLSMTFQLLINVEIIKISGKFRFKTQKLVIYPAIKC